MSAASGNTVLEYLTGLGVEVQANVSVTDYDGERVSLSNGNIIHSRCLIWAAGVKGKPIPGIPKEAVTANDRLLVNSFNQVNGLTDVYALGDIALMQLDDLPRGHPQVAPVAIQQATLLAKNLEHLVTGKTIIPFNYQDQGSMATVGRNLALVEIGKIKLKGFIAWLVWMLVHLMSIIGIKNRLFILINWVWQYITYDQSLRLIIKPAHKIKNNHNETNPVPVRVKPLTGL
jgi:NADH dehydrogenase